MTNLSTMDTNEKNKSSTLDDFGNPSLFKSSVESILFQEDEGPVSSFLNDTADLNVTTPVSTSQQPSKIGSIGTSTISSAEVHDAANGPARNVRFIDLDSFEEEKRSIPEQESTNEVSIILRERIVQVQSELVTEKAMRKKKEKNLIKLAKELNKRSSDAQEKDNKILEITNKVQVSKKNCKVITRKVPWICYPIVLHVVKMKEELRSSIRLLLHYGNNCLKPI